MTSPRALLVSLRDPHDPMSRQELRCFADRAALPHDRVDLHPMVEGRPDKGRLRRYDAVFFGGSGTTFGFGGGHIISPSCSTRAPRTTSSSRSTCQLLAPPMSASKCVRLVP